MSVVLTLRKKLSHAGTPLVHETSEDVVLATVFGILKNLPFDTVLNPWLSAVTRGTITPADDWHLSFWEAQPVPAGLQEGSTKVDLEIASDAALIFTEVKMNALPSPGTTHDENRNQLVRNLDIGYRQASDTGREFAVVYITPDTAEPAVLTDIRKNEQIFKANKDTDPNQIKSRLYWTPWGSIGDTLHDAIEQELLDESETWFGLDLLAYLKVKGLWNRQLSVKLASQIQGDKLYRDLLPEGTFVPHGDRRAVPDQSWRDNDWTETELREYLQNLPRRQRALLKVLADAGGTMKQADILQKLPFLGGSSAALSSLKQGISRACKGKGKAPLLTPGVGAGDQRKHQFNPKLGELRELLIREAKKFDWPDENAG